MMQEARIAFIQSQTAAMLAEMESMKVANAERERQNRAPAYGERDFLNLPAQYALTHNQVIDYLR
jgi:hypothetical protein